MKTTLITILTAFFLSSPILAQDKVTVVYWCKDCIESERFVAQNEEIRVYLATELKKFCREHKSENTDDNLTARLEKLMGLPPTVNNTHFLEFEINRADLWQPSLETQTESTETEETKEIDVVNWQSLLSEIKFKIPWAENGYTCDSFYSGDCHPGLTEFALKPNIEIRATKNFQTTMEYCQ